ncbi:MAG: efflux RND transporter periplasmic adaptor subunit, partial [Acidaminococcaceae bacterium]
MLGKKKVIAIALAVSTIFAVAGCGNKQQAGQKQEVAVKTMQVIKRDTPIVYEYTGFVEAENEVQMKARVSGMITQKFINGGDKVEAGQLMFVIDPRTYQNAALNAEAQLANVGANLSRVRRDAERYQKLYEQGAVSKQMLDNINAELSQAEAQVNAQSALLASAQVDVGETNIVAPFSGQVDTKDLAVGTFVTAGQTVLGTVSSSDPIRVKFSISESDYLQLMKANNDKGTPLDNLTIVLSDGSTYPVKGKQSQVDRGISEGTGSLTIKADFGNPKHILLPGMFAHVQAVAETRKNALLIPQRAVTELLYKTFVTIVTAEGKAELREVQLGTRIGKLWMVNSGLDGSETVIVEGVQKAPAGTPVK